MGFDVAVRVAVASRVGDRAGRGRGPVASAADRSDPAARAGAHRARTTRAGRDRAASAGRVRAGARASGPVMAGVRRTIDPTRTAGLISAAMSGAAMTVGPTIAGAARLTARRGSRPGASRHGPAPVATARDGPTTGPGGPMIDRASSALGRGPIAPGRTARPVPGPAARGRTAGLGRSQVASGRTLRRARKQIGPGRNARRARSLLAAALRGAGLMPRRRRCEKVPPLRRSRKAKS